MMKICASFPHEMNALSYSRAHVADFWLLPDCFPVGKHLIRKTSIRMENIVRFCMKIKQNYKHYFCFFTFLFALSRTLTMMIILIDSHKGEPKSF